MSGKDSRPVYASGDCEIDCARRELRVLGSPVRIGGRAFEIIETLAGSAGDLVTKNELMDRIWPGTNVSSNTLAVHTAAVRKALGPYRAMLKTESGRGYRLLGHWTVGRQSASRPPVGPQRIRIDGESPVTNFPAAVTRLVGREAAVRRLRDLISAWRMVTLTGPGGIGKTVLAMKAARAMLGDFPDGGWLAELASLADPALVPPTVSSVLRLTPGIGVVDPESIARGIGDKRLLLVLDNCEHLIDAVALLTDTLLARCPNVTILATSRESLRIQGERLYRVPPLEVPAPEDVEPGTILSRSGPVLFVRRAQELGADLSSSLDHSPTIAAICRHLDGIPLAIELAAARAAVLGIEQIASGLQDRFTLLTGGRRTALPRHRTLRAILDWSYQLLTETERDLLNRLAVFVGAFSLDGARAVAPPGSSAAAIADGIADLVGKSLVMKTTDSSAAEFRLLETTRVYAMDRLKEAGTLPQVAHQHASFLLSLLGDVEKERSTRAVDEYMADFRRRADEIHAALDWAFSGEGDASLGCALALAAVPLWFALSQMMVTRSRVEQALCCATAGSPQEMRLRIAMGQAIWYTGPESDDIGPMFSRALEIAENLGERAVVLQTLWGLWASRRGHADYPAALQMAQRYARAAEAAGDLSAMHLADRMLGLTHHLLGQQPIALEFTRRALRNPRPLDASSGVGYQVETPIAMATQMARILWLQGRPEQAAAKVAEALAAAHSVADSFATNYVLTIAAVPLALWTGALDEARRLIGLLMSLTSVNRVVERWQVCFENILELRSGNEDDRLTAAYIEPRVDYATLSSLAALTRGRTVPLPMPGPEPDPPLWNAPEILRVDAELLLRHDRSGGAGAAEAKLLRALDIARQQAALSWELRAAMTLARLWWSEGRAEEARELLSATYRQFVEGFDTADLVHARALMQQFRSPWLPP